MASSLIAGLRSVALEVPEVASAEAFYTGIWNLGVAARAGDAVFLRGTGAGHHLLSLHRAARTAVRNITLWARSRAALDAIAANAVSRGGRVIAPVAESAESGGGTALTIADPQGRIIRIVFGDARHNDAAEVRDRPVRLAHVVLNSEDVAAARAFYEQVLDFRMVDRTRIMAFMNCNADHHSLAFADAQENSLNHIAFVMPDLDSVMRGGGRMKDAGFPIEWGPGRHGPGNNAFNYFLGPFDIPIEYTAEVEQIDDGYQVGAPEDWKWPVGRVDHWGISTPPSVRLKEAQKKVFFAPL